MKRKVLVDNKQLAGKLQAMAKLTKILIANRGEIALRIQRACRSLGLKTVSICSSADENSLFARKADELVVIGPPPPQQSYLNIAKLIEVAKEIINFFCFLIHNHFFTFYSGHLFTSFNAKIFSININRLPSKFPVSFSTIPTREVLLYAHNL